MGRAVDAVCAQHGFEVAARLTSADNPRGEAITREALGPVDVAIDFSTADALAVNFPRLAALGAGLVIGTTGWQAHEAAFRAIAATSDIGVVAAANLSPVAVLFEAVVEAAARLFGRRDEIGAWVHELHHAAKRDAPSGTARALLAGMTRAGYARPIDVSSTRAGSIPGTHIVGFDGPFESVTLTHAARDRATFAHGALEAARWVRGRRGWFTMRDVVGI